MLTIAYRRNLCQYSTFRYDTEQYQPYYHSDFCRSSFADGSTAANRSVSTISDFFLCNRSLGTALSFCTIYATWWSSFAFLGSTSSFYTQGPLYWIALGWNVLFGILFCVFGKPLWQQSRLRNYRTPVDFFHDKYHSRPLDIAAILLMVGLSIPYIFRSVSGRRHHH